MATVSGKDGYIQLPTNSNFAFSSWELTMTNDLQDDTNFTTAGYKTNLAGLAGADFTASGPFSSGQALTAGSSYAGVFAINSTVTFNVTVRIATIKPSTDVTKPAQLTVSGKSTGSFTAAIS